jgi:hypothetical protein
MNHFRGAATRQLSIYAMALLCGVIIQNAPITLAQEQTANLSAADQTAKMMQILTAEITSGLQSRNLTKEITQFQNYVGYQLNLSTGDRRVNEVTGNCRLAWYDHMLRNPLQAPAEAETFTGALYDCVTQPTGGLAEAFAIARSKMDVAEQSKVQTTIDASSVEPLSLVAEILERVQQAHARSLAPLTTSELNQLNREIYPLLVSQNDVGFTVKNRVGGRRICDLLEKMDRSAIHDAAEAMVPLTEVSFLKRLKALPEENQIRVAGVSGAITQKIVTPSGCILIGGRDANTYDLDAMPDVNVIIDLGGNDVYREGSVSLDRPVLITLDLGGNDTYVGSKPGIQGAAILGIAMLVDLEGNDRYQSKDMAQGSVIGGAGVLVDHAGNDHYIGFRRVQGQSLAGIGVLIDRDGDDQYHGAMWTQGMGCPLGFGMLADLNGNDRYYTGGHFICSYADDEDNPTPGYEGWGQGVGAGLRSVASGGIGVLIDGNGDDIYEFDYLSHGGGYWLGLGFARDFGGNDKRLGATQKSYSGGPREQPSFQRFGMGFGCHYAAGFCFDDEGNDTYNGTIMGLGHAWDASLGVLADFAGNDEYRSNAKTTQGNGSQASIGILFDYAGDDRYRNHSQGYASNSISYHEMPASGGNFSFLIDFGGTDTYGCRARNNSVVRQGSNGGFLIDVNSPMQTKTAQSPSPKQPSTTNTTTRTTTRTTTKTPVRSSARR